MKPPKILGILRYAAFGSIIVGIGLSVSGQSLEIRSVRANDQKDVWPRFTGRSEERHVASNLITAGACTAIAGPAVWLLASFVLRRRTLESQKSNASNREGL
jgi:hypothetical protein